MPRPLTCGGVLQTPLNFSDDHLDRDRVVTAARNDHIRVSLARLDELEVHRLNGGQVLLDDFIQRPAAHVSVALDAADESNVRVGIDENLDVAEVANPFIDEQQNPVDDNDVGRLDTCCIRAPQVRHEIILRFRDGLPVAQRIQVRDEKIVVESIGMIPIELPALIE
jgi:hypothetical protein